MTTPNDVMPQPATPLAAQGAGPSKDPELEAALRDVFEASERATEAIGGEVHAPPDVEDGEQGGGELSPIDPAIYEEDLTPEDGDHLEPGDYLIELETIRPCAKEVLVEGFRRIGFQEVLLDQNPPAPKPRALIRDHRFVGRLIRPVVVKQLPDATWTYARRLKTNVLGELRLKQSAQELVRGRVYEARFITRMRSQPTRAMVDSDLIEMGFHPLKLSALRRDMRIPSRPGASVTLWFAILVWEAADSCPTEDDPFYFEDLIEV